MKKFFVYFSLAIFTTMGIYVMVTAEALPLTYSGKNTNLTELQRDSKNYSLEDPDGSADIIVKQSLSRTGALNVVNATALDFRGYDTLGQSFILLAAVSGCSIVLGNRKKTGGELDEEKHES